CARDYGVGFDYW
nr:immunoglobulin heavy chain junction region [Mus musculus]